jgi:chromate reductase
MYNADNDGPASPPAVVELRAAVRRADAVLIATPEYNYGIPAVLKNAIDWLSRPPSDSPLVNKPTAIMGASGGVVGTARAQQQLRLILTGTRTPVMLPPEILVGTAQEKFDAAGRLTDEATRKFLADGLRSFVDWIERFPRS